MTPLENPTGLAENHYNNTHEKAQIKLNRCLSILTNNFRILLGGETINYSHVVASNIIQSCATLHNFLIKYKFELDVPQKNTKQYIP